MKPVWFWLVQVRYIIALIVLLSLPPSIMLWLMIHPFARFWRKLGPGWTYGLLGVPVAIVMVGLFLARDSLLATEFGTSYPLIALTVLCLTGAAIIAQKRRKHLTFGILAGLPELSQKRYPGKLLTDGLYAKIRHPRYVETLLWVLGYAFFANYLALYIVFLLSLPAIYFVVIFEERELRDRFGAEYDNYCRKVPRFVPSISQRS
ncbi:MAG: methyltransferase family protein [bacterium]